MDIMKYQEYIKNIGFAGFVLVVLYLGYTRTWVWGAELKEEQARTATAIAERDRWMNLAVQGTKLAEDAATRTGKYHMVGANIDTQMTPQEVSNRLDSIKKSLHPGIE